MITESAVDTISMKSNLEFRFMNERSASNRFTIGSRSFIFILIFLSILPVACVDVWNQAWVVVCIFGLAALCSIKLPEFEVAPEISNLLLPLSILGGYSFVQGATTLGLTELGYSLHYRLIPLSFDPITSLWVAVKIAALGLFLVILQLFFRERIKQLCYGLLLIGIFYAMFGILRFLMGDSFIDVFGFVTSPRLQTGVGFGTYFNQNHFGFLMEMVFGLGIGLFRYPSQPRAWRFIALIGSLTSWAALVLTGSRGAILGSFVSIALFIFVSAGVPSRSGKERTQVWSLATGASRFGSASRHIAATARGRRQLSWSGPSCRKI